jgi:hypothetical protein
LERGGGVHHNVFEKGYAPGARMNGAETQTEPSTELIQDGAEDEDGEEEADDEASSVDSDSDVSLVSDDEISASKVRQRVAEERQANPKTKKQRTQ